MQLRSDTAGMGTTGNPTEVRRYGRAELLEFVATCRPEDVTVTGFPGSGFTLLTDVLGEETFVGKAWPGSATPVLIVMRQMLTLEQASMLNSLGVDDPEHTVASLCLGEALVITSS